MRGLLKIIVKRITVTEFELKYQLLNYYGVSADAFSLILPLLKTSGIILTILIYIRVGDWLVMIGNTRILFTNLFSNFFNRFQSYFKTK